MNTKQMTRWGIGPKFTIISLIYVAIVIVIQNTLLTEFRFVIYSTLINKMLGIVLILIGFITFIIPAFNMASVLFMM